MPRETFLNRNFKLIQPLLNEIETLEFAICLERHIPYPFTAPKLKELSYKFRFHYIGLVTLGTGILMNAHPNLERLTIEVGIHHDILEPFLERHQQLKYLLKHTTIYRHLLSTINNVSTNLEELVIFHNSYIKEYRNDWTWNVKSNKLSKLMIHSVMFHYNDIAIEILTDFQKLNTLRSIAVTEFKKMFLYNISDAIIGLSREITHLEHFCTDASVNSSTIIRIITNAHHLKTFCAIQHRIACPITSDFIDTLINIRKSLFENRSDEVIVLDLILYPHSAEEAECEKVN